MDVFWGKDDRMIELVSETWMGSSFKSSIYLLKSSGSPGTHLLQSRAAVWIKHLGPSMSKRSQGKICCINPTQRAVKRKSGSEQGFCLFCLECWEGSIISSKTIIFSSYSERGRPQADTDFLHNYFLWITSFTLNANVYTNLIFL